MARPLSAEARQKILDAAADVLAEVGVESFTVDEVSRRSKVAKSTIYRHFSSTDELLLNALDCRIVALPTPNTGSLQTDLFAFLEAAKEFMADESMPKLMAGVLHRTVHDDDFAAMHGSFMDQQRMPMKTIVQLAQARGEVDPDLDPELAVDVLEGPFFMHKVVRRQEVDEQTALNIVRLAIAALTNYTSMPISDSPQD